MFSVRLRFIILILVSIRLSMMMLLMISVRLLMSSVMSRLRLLMRVRWLRRRGMMRRVLRVVVMRCLRVLMMLGILWDRNVRLSLILWLVLILRNRIVSMRTLLWSRLGSMRLMLLIVTLVRRKYRLVLRRRGRLSGIRRLWRLMCSGRIIL